MLELRFLVYLLEGVAATCCFYYLGKNPNDKPTKILGYFLLITYLVESLGDIPNIIYRYESLHFLMETFLSNNFWLYNPYLIINFLVLIHYFKLQLRNAKLIKMIDVLMIIYLIGCITNLIFSNDFFTTNSPFTFVLGSLFLLNVIFLYYFKVLKSSKLLIITKEISFYISIGTVIFYLCTTPIVIYFNYFDSFTSAFGKLSSFILVATNIFMYSTFSIAFVWLANKKKPPSKNLKNAF